MAAAARADSIAISNNGACSADVELIAKCGCGGKYPQNIERDLSRAMRRSLSMQVRPYLQKVEGVTVAVILPHEWFAELLLRWPRQAEKLLGSAHERGQFWAAMDTASEEWFDVHPLKQYARQFPHACMPIRVWGDDAPTGESRHANRSIRTACWSAATTKSSSLTSRFLSWAIDPSIIKDDQPLWATLAWSFNVMASGR